MVVAHVHRRAARHCAAGSRSASWTARQAHAHAHGAPPVAGHRTRGECLRKPRAALLNRAQGSSAETATSSSALPEPASRTRRRPSERGQQRPQATAIGNGHRQRPSASGHRQRATNWLTIGIGEVGSCSRQRRSAAAGCPTSSLHTGVAMAVAVWVAESVHQRAVDLRLRQDKRHGPRVRRSNRGPQPGRRGALVVGDARAIKASAGPRGCTASGRYSVSRRRGAARRPHCNSPRWPSRRRPRPHRGGACGDAQSADKNA